MSEKKLPSREEILLLQYSRTEESADQSDDSQGRRQEVAASKDGLQNLIRLRDWTQQRVEYYGNEAKRYELQGLNRTVQMARARVHSETENIKRYNKSILKMEQRIKWLTLKYSAALANKQDDATMEVARPPSDQE